MTENKNYKYLLSLKSLNKNEEKIIAILKEQSNVKSYILEAIENYELSKNEDMNEQVFKKNVEKRFNRMESLLEEINRNTGI